MSPVKSGSVRLDATRIDARNSCTCSADQDEGRHAPATALVPVTVDNAGDARPIVLFIPPHIRSMSAFTAG